MNKALLFLFFASVMALGYWMSERAWDGQVYVYMGSERSPAAVRQLRDYTPVEGRSITRTAQEQLLADAQLDKQDGFLGIKLGQILVRREDGAREFACEANGRPGLFDRIELTFVGEGIAESGEPAKMVVDSKCSSLTDLDRLDTIWVPMQEILSLKPQDQDLQSRGEDPTFIKMQTVPSSWPTSWTLQSVKLYRRSSLDTQALTIGTAQLMEMNGKRLAFDWK